MQRTLSLLAAFFAVLLLMEKQKISLLFLQRFLQTLFLENDEKTSEKNKEKCFPIHLKLTYQKLGKAEQKLETTQKST